MFDSSIQGHHLVRERLLARLSAGTLSGSLLFTGPEAVGKKRVAMELAQRELCLSRRACGQCEGCKLFKQVDLPVEWPNLLRIAPEGKAGIIKIGAIREDDLVEGGVIRWVHQAALPGTHRWILIEDAHRLNGASANMLLKTLEEPPPDTHFLLVTHRPDAVLQTIRSRCERVAFKPLSDQEAWQVAQGAGWGLEDMEQWTALAAGTLRLIDPALYARAVEQLSAWLSVLDGKSFFEVSDALLPDKQSDKAQSVQLASTLELLLVLLNDIARCKAGHPLRLAPWEPEVKRAVAKAIPLKEALDGVHHALRHLSRNPHAESLLAQVAFGLVAEK